MLFSKTFVVAAFAFVFASVADAHSGLRTPCPRYGAWAGCPAPPPGESVDYDINAPIGTHDRILQPICKHTKPATKRVTYSAGQTIKTQYNIGAAHGGGHCQWSISYDGGKKWLVIKTVIRNCLRNINNGGIHTINVQIPKNAPSGNAIFQWQWNNAIGNRELYSNCADITIKGTNGGTLKGVSPLMMNYGKNSYYVGEFPNANQPDGSELFAKRKSITITVPKRS